MCLFYKEAKNSVYNITVKVLFFEQWVQETERKVFLEKYFSLSLYPLLWEK